MTLDELNAIVESGGIDEFIRVCEARQVKALSKIADDITARPEIRVVLLAGASSAGKTTTAKRLCTQLRVNGADAMHLSTDDYFVGDRRNPRDENGELDYECVQCVDMERLAADINALMRGEGVKMRRFNFVEHEGYDETETTSLSEGGILVLEGIHALNPLLTEGVDDGCKFRIFIEPKTQPVLFLRARLPSTDARLLRRIVRDNQFRKMDPQETFRRWPMVLAGEDKWINPFRPNADAEFDSALAYELAVLKPYVEGLLARVLMKNPEERKALFLCNLLSMVLATDPTKVPGDSILRETIGGSQLEY
ncbi:MAG: nucleoside kinase [Kiritimatiellae bacterium]|nr:nucleoside kinase [Kiritimatiellia bacterium]